VADDQDGVGDEEPVAAAGQGDDDVAGAVDLEEAEALPPPAEECRLARREALVDLDLPRGECNRSPAGSNGQGCGCIVP
jgi:hypothetical protein